MAPAAGDPPAGGGSRRQALAALCLTEVVSYGVIYYAFPVLAGHITAATGWSRTAITAAYSAGNLAGALAGIPAGRLLHRVGPHPVMTAASVLGAASVAGVEEPRRGDLLTLLREAKQRGWMQPYRSELPEVYSDYIGLEDEARSISN